MTKSIQFSTIRLFARIVCPLFLFLVLLLPAAHASDWTGNVSGYVGQKFLDDQDWSHLDQQFSLGMLFDIRQKNWPVSIVFDILGSGDVHEDGSRKVEGYTLENNIGVRKVFELPNSSIRPYIGGGIAFISAKLEDNDGANTTSQDDSAVGAWLGVGVYVGLTPNLILGFDARYSQAEVTLLGEQREAGGLNTGITVGFHW